MKIPALLVLSLALCACNTAPTSDADRADLAADVQAAVTAFKNADSAVNRFFESAHGYAVFPSVGKAGIGLGGATGRGEVFEGSSKVGYSRLSQATIGFQLGAQTYREIIFFRDEQAFESFIGGNFEFSAQASAVLLTEGAAATADYEGGVAVFTLPTGGAMYEASVGGQKFEFDRIR